MFFFLEKSDDASSAKGEIRCEWKRLKSCTLKILTRLKCITQHFFNLNIPIIYSNEIGYLRSL